MDSNTYFARLKKDVQPYVLLMGKAADTILDENVSSYPIFVVSQEVIDIGIPIVKKEEGNSLYFINVSTLEELATKKIIGMDRVDNFRSIYKSPESHICLFVLNEEGATFVFVPRI